MYIYIYIYLHICNKTSVVSNIKPIYVNELMCIYYVYIMHMSMYIYVYIYAVKHPLYQT
jgi:hypothetical protein